MKAQYKDLKFNSEKEFEEWLKKHTCTTIYFVDFGQDLIRMYLSNTGEILHCNLQAWLYNGKFVDVNNLRANEPLRIFEEDKYKNMMSLIVEEIYRK